MLRIKISIQDPKHYVFGNISAVQKRLDIHNIYINSSTMNDEASIKNNPTR